MKITPTKILHYGLLLTAAYIVYTWLTQEDPKDNFANHPRNKDKFKVKDDAEGRGHKYADDARHVQDDVDEANDHIVRPKKQEHQTVKRQNQEPKRAQETVKPEVDQRDKLKHEREKEIGKEKHLDKVPERVKEEVKIVDEPKPTKLKWKGKDKEEGKDFLKEINDAELRGDKDILKNMHNLSEHVIGHIPKIKKQFGDEYDDLEMAEEKKRRRKVFFEQVRKRESPEELDEDHRLHEKEDDFAFVTAASSDSYKAAIYFIYSVQNNFPDAVIGIFDIGLTPKEVYFLRSLCSVDVYPNIIKAFPSHLHADMKEKMWRPVILQLASAKYGHYVYLDPMRVLKRNVDLKGHFDLSRMGGAAMFGIFKSYSTAVVTHPDMYYFLAADVRKLYKLQHMEINMMIIHNSDQLRHFFLRWLTECTYEQYCIAPPGAQRKCDMNLYPNSKKYADCHRYDESAINILLASWHKYDVDHYAAVDHVTQYFGGYDMSMDVKKCNNDNVKEGL